MQNQDSSETVKRLLLAEKELDNIRLEMSQVQREAYERDQTLTKQLRDMTAKKDEIEEELTRYEN